MVRTFQLVASVLALATAAQAFVPPTPIQGREALTRVNLWGNFGGGNKKAESTSSSKPMAQGTKKPAAPPAPAAKKSPFSFGGASKPAAAAPPKAAPKAPVRPPLPKAPAAKAPPAAPKGAATSKMGMKAFSKNSDDMLGKKRPTAMDYRGMVVTEDEEVIVPATDYFANKSDPIVPTIAFALFGVIFGLLGWWLFSPVPEPQAVDPNAKTSYEQYMQQSRSSSKKF